jgi:hypothetical protein
MFAALNEREGRNMRKSILLASVALALVLAGCSAEQAMKSAPMTEAAAPEMARDMAAEAPAAAPEPAGGGQGGGGANPGGPLLPSQPTFLAYQYATQIEAPAAKVEPLMQAHEKACRAAGSNVCQVLGASTNTEGPDYVSAQLELRAEPRWLQSFRDGLAGQAKAADGRIKGSSVTAEDLTRAIVDTQARLQAQKTLRERLQQILRERPGKLGELLETERELARVQGEIDAQESELAVMRARVSMSRLSLGYQTKPSAVTGGAFEPIGDAFNNFFRVVAQGFASLIYVIAALLPWLVVGGPLAWFGMRWLRGRKAKKPAS